MGVYLVSRTAYDKPIAEIHRGRSEIDEWHNDDRPQNDLWVSETSCSLSQRRPFY